MNNSLKEHYTHLDETQTVLVTTSWYEQELRHVSDAQLQSLSPKRPNPGVTSSHVFFM